MTRTSIIFILATLMAAFATQVRAQSGGPILVGWGSSANDLLLVASPGENVYKPVVIPSSYFDNETVVAVASGSDFAVAVTENGAVYTWGSNVKGQLGNAAAGASSSVPVRVEGLGPEYDEVVVTVAATRQSAVAITQSGFIWTWGSNTRGVLGNGSKIYAEGSFAPTPVWALLPTGAGKPISVGCGNSAFCVVLTNSNKVYSWGSNEDGTLGYNSGGVTYVTIPAPANLTVLEGAGIAGPDTVKSVSVGGRHVAALTESGKVLVWGANTDGQLGNGNSGPQTNSFTPIISNFSRHGFVAKQVSSGGSHVLALTTNNIIYGWGLSQSLQLGSNISGNGLIQPNPVPFADQPWMWGNVTHITGFTDSTFATTNQARLYGWGDARNYILGSNTTLPSFGPIKANLDNLPEGYFIDTIFSSGFATTAFAIATQEAMPPLTPITSGPGAAPGSQEPPPFTPPVQPPQRGPAFSGGVPTPGNNAPTASLSALLALCAIFASLFALL